MCAIAGVVGLNFNETILQKMIETMRRRGPDGEGSYHGAECILLHTRLAIVDLEGGKQPMELTRSGEHYIITYNGELYNTQELRIELCRLGHTFFTHSDTEVVLHAYAQWKEAALDKLNGIFAFAVLEEKKNRLFLARDRMGVKPLFYKLHEGGLLFASEIKTILTYPTVDAVLNAEGVAQLIMLGPGRIPGSGVFRGIEEVEPGCYGIYEAGKLLCKRYWKLMDREHADSFVKTVDTVRYLVTDSISRQMVSDVPIGTFLSGGLDSSLISALCCYELKKEGIRLKTFSLDYKNNDIYFKPGKFQPNSDTHYIQVMQNDLQTEHIWTILEPEGLPDVLEEATCARDLPGMADVDFSLLQFCSQIRSHVKVALSGECADEIFGGYPWYRDPEVRALEGFPWAQNTTQRAAFLNQDIAQKINGDEFVKDLYQQTIDQCDILPGTSLQEKRIKEMVNLNYRWFMQTLLDRKDRMSMYNGLEVRVPFCDYRIAEYMYAVPWEYKDYRGCEKGLLRYAMQGVLPNEILWRKKSPYPKTHDPAYMEKVSKQLRKLLMDKNAPVFALVNKDTLQQLLDAEFTWPWYGQLMRVPQTIAYMLQLNCWMEKYCVKIAA